MTIVGRSIAKITRPKLSHIASRERLFRLLDKGRSKPVTWIASQAGSGKTTLVASWLDSRKLPCLWYQVDGGDGDLASFFYFLGLAVKKTAPRYKQQLPHLTPEYLSSIPIFTRRYFEELFRRIKPPYVLVFDNYQDAPKKSGLNEVLAHALETVPEGFRVIVLSRDVPPPQFARLQANNRLQAIGWDNVRFTRKESECLMKAQGQGAAVRKTIDRLYEKTEGWAAGLVLLMAGAPETGFHTVVPETPDAIFDYFATEIFNKLDAQTQYLLLATAVLPVMPVSIVVNLSGIKEAGSILDRLNKQHFFTEKITSVETSYQYHALFREFLLERASSYFDPAELLSIRRNAAALLQASGRLEAAADLFLITNNWVALTRLILNNAQELISQGRHKTLESWIIEIPAAECQNNPWLIYWLGLARMAFNLPTSLAHMQDAFRLFESSSDETGVYLAWAGAVDNIIYEFRDVKQLDFWIDWLDLRMGHNPRFPSVFVEICVASSMVWALLWRRPSHSRIHDWVERVSGLLSKTDDLNLRLRGYLYVIWYHGMFGNLSQYHIIEDEIRMMFRSSRISPLLAISWSWHESVMAHFSTANPDRSIHLVNKGLSESNAWGIHIGDHWLYSQGAIASLSKGDAANAEQYVQKLKGLLEQQHITIVQYPLVLAWLNLLSGNITSAVAYAETAAQMSEMSGLVLVQLGAFFVLSQILHEAGNFQRADNLLSTVEELVRESRNVLFEYAASLGRALFSLDRGDESSYLLYAKRSLTIGRSQGFTNLPWWTFSRGMHRVFAKALELNIETEYIRSLIRKHNLVSPDYPVRWDAWPWPVRIHTLGTFKILKNDKPMTFPGKVQKKPLELLKVLISFGGTDVAEERISDALWPDAEGDTAHRSFETTLYRLRKLVGDSVVRLQEGLVTIDRGQCWVDVWAFDQLTDSIGNIGNEDVQRSEEAVELYRGHFLPTDVCQPWSLSLREKLRSRFVGMITLLGTNWEEEADWARALEYFMKGLEIDELEEEFYRHAMMCHARLGNSAQVISVYHRCRSTLQRALGIAPSAKTEALYATVRTSGEPSIP